MEDNKNDDLFLFVAVVGVALVSIILILALGRYIFSNPSSEFQKKYNQKIEILKDKLSLLDKRINSGYEVVISKSDFKEFKISLNHITDIPTNSFFSDFKDCETYKYERYPIFLYDATIGELLRYLKIEKENDITECNNLSQKIDEKTQQILRDQEIEVRFILEDKSLLKSEDKTEIYSAKLKEINTDVEIKLEDILKLNRIK